MTDGLITHRAAPAALRWITGFFHEQSVHYLITGGLATLAYGGRRPLADIDIYVPAEHYFPTLQFARDYIDQSSHHYQDEHWNLELAELNYQGQSIEVCRAENIQIFNQQTQQWQIQAVDFDRHEIINLLGSSVRVMHPEDLIHYKLMLQRPVDLDDFAAMQTAQ